MSTRNKQIYIHGQHIPRNTCIFISRNTCIYIQSLHESDLGVVFFAAFIFLNKHISVDTHRMDTYCSLFSCILFFLFIFRGQGGLPVSIPLCLHI